MNMALKFGLLLPSPLVRSIAFFVSLLSVTLGTLCLKLDRQIIAMGLPLPLVYSYSLPSASPARVRITRSSGSSIPILWGELVISLEDYYNASQKTLTFHEDEVRKGKGRRSAGILTAQSLT